ncbi:MAG: ATP-binding cassette domain-containing protein [bacterium]
MIEIKGVSKKFNTNLALDNISFNVKQGEVLGFLGPNGAGKTTTMKIITGFWQASEGTVIVEGTNVAEDSLAVRKKIGYLPETVPLYDEMKVFEYLKFVAGVRDIPKEKIIPRIKEVIESCGLQQVIGKSIEELSKGFRQRVGLAQAIMHDPDILILDEPTTGLDPNQIVEIRDLIKKVGKEKTVIFSTHILAEAQATCDRVVIINKGKIVGEGRPDELANAMNRNNYCLKVKGPQDSVLLILRALPGILSVEVVEPEVDGLYEYKIQPKPGVDIREQIASRMQDNNWLIFEFSKQSASLEEVFRELTK